MVPTGTSTNCLSRVYDEFCSMNDNEPTILYKLLLANRALYENKAKKEKNTFFNT